MQIVPLQAIPNYEFPITLDNNLWDISLKAAGGITAVTLVLNGNTVIENVRAVAGTPLLPYRYEENGNFMFVTSGGELPAYTKFNVTQFLYYYSQSELAIFRAGALMFNPLGGLPLRYKPVGYVSG